MQSLQPKYPEFMTTSHKFQSLKFGVSKFSFCQQDFVVSGENSDVCGNLALNFFRFERDDDRVLLKNVKYNLDTFQINTWVPGTNLKLEKPLVGFNGPSSDTLQEYCFAI